MNGNYKCELPNLELILYMAEERLMGNQEFLEKYGDAKEKNKWVRPTYELDVFLQTWENTSCGFDVTAEGEPVLAGQAFTDAYTVVVREKVTDTYLVFFDGRPCYMVGDPNEKFLEDLKNRRMESLSRAKTVY